MSRPFLRKITLNLIKHSLDKEVVQLSLRPSIVGRVNIWTKFKKDFPVKKKVAISAGLDIQ